MKKNYQAWNIKPIKAVHTLKDRDKLKYFCRYAILAPSGHNTQPWSFKFDGDSLLIMENQNRSLPFSGKLAAEPFVSLGSCTETLRMAAQAYGYEVGIARSHQKNAFYKITIGNKTYDNSSLAAAIASRVSDRSFYEDSPINKNALDSIVDNDLENVSVVMLTKRKHIEYVAAKTLEATKIIMTRPKFRHELSHWVRNNKTKRYDGMPGSVQGIPTPPSLVAKHVVRHVDVSKTQGKTDAKRVLQSPCLLVLTINSDTDDAHLNLGRLYARICVQAQLLGYATSGVGAAVIDPSTKKELRNYIKTQDLPSAIIRVGKTTSKKAPPRTPRWPLDKVLIN